jgi:hypothetical protein
MNRLVAFSCAVLVVLAALFFFNIGLFGLSLFVVVPLSTGALGAMAFQSASAKRAAGAGSLTTAIAGFSLLLIGKEGLICIVMALPLTVPLGALGGYLFFAARRSLASGRGTVMLIMLPVASFAWDVNARPPVFRVVTAVEVAATPEQVWKRVVMFSELPEPTEWYFRAGIAYPQRAGIIGSGANAVRYCQFSTGPFVEPVEVWDEPRVLQFRVSKNPAPLREWSPYKNIHPKHLHGYMFSERGRFRLEELANHHTLLEANSWYRHGLGPAWYWRLWSDAIIHRIHLRVLTHIQTMAEADAVTGEQVAGWSH